MLDVIDLYRCADCQTAFCRDCIRRHFRDQTPEEQERMRRLENELAADADATDDDAEGEE